MKRWVLVCLVLILYACAAQPTPEPTPAPDIPLILKQEDNPYAPQSGDLNKREAGVILTSLNLLERADLDPIRTELNITGSMPSVCNELRVTVDPPDDARRVAIKIYSLVDPNLNCENVFQQFKATLLLGVYSQGQYAVWVNGTYIGEFTSY